MSPAPRPRPLAALLAALALSACAVPFVGRDKPFVPRSDYGIPPVPTAYSKPGDCRGGSRLAAVDVKDPVYPKAAFRRGQQGWVALRLDVDPQGRTRHVEVVDSQPVGPFEGAARKTVRSWRFRPPGEQGLTRCVVVLDYRLGVGKIGL